MKGAMYAVAGFVLSVAGVIFALAYGRRAASFYAREVYHMSDRSHVTFATFSGACAALFGVSFKVEWLTTPVLAVYVLVAILYGSSFLRGFGEE